MARIIEKKDKNGEKIFEIDYRKMISGISYGSKRVLRGVTKEKARAILNVELNRIYSGEYKIKNPARKHRLSRAIDEYLRWSRDHKAWNTFRADKSSLSFYLTYSGDVHIDSLSAFGFEGFKRRRLENVRKVTVNKDIKKVKAFFNWCVRNGLLERSPLGDVSRYKEEERDHRVLSSSEEELLLKSASPRIRLFIVIALNTGMRKGEILGLKWKDVDFDRGIIRVYGAKTNKFRDIYMNGWLIDELRVVRAETDSEWVISFRGEKIEYTRNGLIGAVKRAGIPHLRAHDLRHTFITRMIEAGVDHRTIMEFTGQKRLEELKRYSHPQAEHKKESVERLVRQKNFGRYLEEKNTGEK